MELKSKNGRFPIKKGKLIPHSLSHVEMEAKIKEFELKFPAVPFYRNRQTGLPFESILEE